METLKEIIISVSGVSIIVSAVLILLSIVFSAFNFIKRRTKNNVKLKSNIIKLREEKIDLLYNKKMRKIRSKLLFEPVHLDSKDLIISRAKKLNLSVSEIELAGKIRAIISKN